MQEVLKSGKISQLASRPQLARVLFPMQQFHRLLLTQPSTQSISAMQIPDSNRGAACSRSMQVLPEMAHDISWPCTCQLCVEDAVAANR